MTGRTGQTEQSAAVITADDVAAAAERIAGGVRRVALVRADPEVSGAAELFLACEFMQHTGSFKARGALNHARAHLKAGTMPDAGVTIASGGNAGLACAWAARAAGVKATVFLPATAPSVKVTRLHRYGADVRLVGTEYAHAVEASAEHADESGALLSHAYDNPLIAAGAGTCAAEALEQLGAVDTIVVAVGGGGLFSGTAAAALPAGTRVVAVEPENCRALNAALETGGPVDVTVDSIAADSLGARRVSQMAYSLATDPGVTSVLVPDEAIVKARADLWEHRRIAAEHGGAAALAALMSGSYRPAAGERVVVVLCGANTDPATLPG